MFGHIYRKRYARPTRLKNIRIDEVSSVDKGAGLGVEVVLLKNQQRSEAMSVIEKAMRMSERELVQFAKTAGIDKPTLSQLIDDKAQALRKDGESREQAFVRYITTNPEGRDLYQIMRASAGMDHHQAAALKLAKAAQRPGEETHPPGERLPGDDDDDDFPGNPYHAALMHLADKHIERSGNMKMSREQAFTHLAEHSDLGRKLMVRAKEFDMKRAARAQA